MKYKHPFIICLILLSASALAQNCKVETIAQQPGIWKDETNGSVAGISASDLASERKTVAAIQAMMKSTYAPKGVNAIFNGTFQRAESSAPSNAFGFSLYPMNLYCDGGTVKAVHETSSYFSINANLFDAEIYETAPEDNLLGYFTMDDMPIEKDGNYHFPEKSASLGLGMTGKTRMWLITYDKKLPFAYASKKDFLLKRKEILTQQMNQSASGSKDVLNSLEIEKTYRETEFKNAPDKFQKYLKLDYTPRKERYEKLLADNEKVFKTAFDKIDALLKMPAPELNAPAIVKVDPQDHLSYLFTDDNDPFGHILIKPNPAYFNTKLPRSSPQFFWVYIAGNHKEPVASAAITDITTAINFTTLKSMLGK